MRTTRPEGYANDPRLTESTKVPIAAIACGVLGFAAAVTLYWLVVPGVALGIAAIVLGVKARRRDDRERGNIAITLGVVAVLLVPATLGVAHEAEEWGRHCEGESAPDPNC